MLTLKRLSGKSEVSAIAGWYSAGRGGNPSQLPPLYIHTSHYWIYIFYLQTLIRRSPSDTQLPLHFFVCFHFLFESLGIVSGKWLYVTLSLLPLTNLNLKPTNVTASKYSCHFHVKTALIHPLTLKCTGLGKKIWYAFYRILHGIF